MGGFVSFVGFSFKKTKENPTQREQPRALLAPGVGGHHKGSVAGLRRPLKITKTSFQSELGILWEKPG